MAAACRAAAGAPSRAGEPTGRRTGADADPTPTWSPTTKPVPPSTTTGTCAAAATRAAPIHDAAWNAELDAAGRWLDALPIHGEIVELAAGTGWWSPLLASKGELSLYDAAGPARPRPRAAGRASACGPTSTSATRGRSRTGRSTAVFTGFWLSHVERDRLADFLALVRRWLKPGRDVRVHRLAAGSAVERRRPPRAGRRSRRSDASTTAASSRSSRSSTSRPSWRRPSRGRLRGRRGHDDRPLLPDRVARRAGRTSRPQTVTRGVRSPSAILRPMSPLANATIATVGSGVMAEAMIAGLLRGELVEPGAGRRQPPAARTPRGARARVRHPHRRRATSTRSRRRRHPVRDQAPDARPVGREIGPHLRRGQLVLCVLAGATTAALTGILGHDQVVRSMPNTPARLGKGMTVWYATPETTDDQRAQAAALLGALGVQLEVDDEKMVAMATAVSGTGPTYVFLVMEALIDAAVHLGFPRHIAHDLVIETLEGSTLFAKQSGMHPAELRNMVTSPGGTSAAALHELESGRLRTVLSEAVWAAFRRTVELGDQLEASIVAERRAAERRSTGRPTRTTTAAMARAVDLRRAPLAESAVGPPRTRSATCGPTRPRSGTGSALVGRPRRRRVAPARRRAVGCRRPDWSLAEHVGHVADWQELAIDYAGASTGRWPSTTTTTAATSTVTTSAAAPWTTMPARDLAARGPHAPPCGDFDGVRATRVGLGLLTPRPLPDHLASSSRGPRLRQATATRSSPTRARDHAGLRAGDRRLERVAARRAGRRGDPGWTLRDHVGHLADWAARRPGDAFHGGHWLSDPDEGIDAWNERTLAVERAPRTRPLRPAATARRRTLSSRLRSPDGWSWAYDCLHGHVRKHLAMRPWAHARPAVRGRPAGLRRPG